MKSSPVIEEYQLLVITMPHSRVLKLISRSVLLCLLIVMFPWIESFAPNSNKFVPIHEIQIGVPNSSYLPLIFQDLFNQGLLRSGDQALYVHTGNEDDDKGDMVIDNRIDIVSESFHQALIGDDSFDLVITSGCCVLEFVEPRVKVGGILVVELNGHPISSKLFKMPTNYKIVYVRRFQTTVVAMRKLSTNGDGKSVKNPILNLVGRRRLLGNFELQHQMMVAALDGLEDVMFEPPRGKDYLRKINYLPDLTGDSLDRYPRRLFIEVALPDEEGTTSSIEWFKKNYPMRNTKFEIYNIKMELATESAALPHPQLSEWLWKNVNEGEYVVMKAEAEAVEDMLGSGAISLVDELFLECNHQWQRGRKNKGNNRRAYWECLALYGRVRDEGIAVHQWWE